MSLDLLSEMFLLHTARRRDLFNIYTLKQAYEKLYHLYVAFGLTPKSYSAWLFTLLNYDQLRNSFIVKLD